jgi:rhodanese-related sulfurtransferase
VITVREVLLLLGLAALPAALAVMLHPELADRHRAGLPADAVRPAEVNAWTAPVLWVDSREAASFDRGHVPGAIRLDEATFSESLGALVAAWAPGMRIVVYCDSSACALSGRLAQRLRDAGFTDVYHLHGGWEAWTQTDASR